MLTQIREKMGSIFLFLMLGVLIASFALWGAGGAFVGTGGVVATVDGQPITATELDRGLQNEVDRYREQLGGDFDTRQALNLNLHYQVLTQLIQKKALDNEAEELGLLGSDQGVRDSVMAIEAFHDLGGNFSRVTYDQQLGLAGLSIKEFEDQIRQDIARTQLIDGFTETALVPQRLVETLFVFRKEKRSALVVTIPADVVSGVTRPTPQELKNFYTSLSASLKTPELRDLRVLVLRPNDFAATITFTEEELQAQYKKKSDEYSTPEQRRVEVAVLRNEAEAREFYERVTQGADFTALATEMTGFAPDEQSLGRVSKATLEQNYTAATAEAVFAAPRGGVTAPSSTLLAWQVFRVSEIVPAVTRAYRDVKPELEASLAAEKGVDALYDTVGKIDDQLNEGASFDEILKSTGLKPVEIQGISARGLYANGRAIADPAFLPLIQKAFAYSEDQPLDLEEAPGQNTFYLVNVDRVIPSAPLPFETIKGELEQEWMARERLKVAGQRAEAALQALRTGASPESLAVRYGGRVLTIGPYQRDLALFSRELSPSIAKLMFTLKLGEAGIEQDAQGKGYVLLMPTTAIAADPAVSRIDLLQIRNRVLNDFKNDLFVQLEKSIEQGQSVAIKKKTVDQIYQVETEGESAQR